MASTAIDLAPLVRKLPPKIARQVKAVVTLVGSIVGAAATLVTQLPDVVVLPVWASSAIGAAVTVVAYVTAYVLPNLELDDPAADAVGPTVLVKSDVAASGEPADLSDYEARHAAAQDAPVAAPSNEPAAL